MAMADLFDENWYLGRNADVATAVRAGWMTGREHFDLYGAAEGRSPGPWFDSAFYLSSNPDVALAVRSGQTTAYGHFLSYGAAENRSPIAAFDADFYLSQNGDVAQAVQAGLFTAVQHFVHHGWQEVRSVMLGIDLGTYLAANPDVAVAVRQGQVSALAHLQGHGLPEARNLGNGIDLAWFQEDAIFGAALAEGDIAAALLRIASVAPFLPVFVRPAGWVPAANTEIPRDFKPPAGVKLVVPPEVSVPAGVILPDWFERHGGEDPAPIRFFTLTAGADTIIGTAGDDTVEGIVTDIGGQQSTLSAIDRIDGGAGTDTLNIAITGTTTDTTNGAEIKHIDIVNVHHTGTADAVLDASLITGLSQVYSDRSTGALTVSNLAMDAAVGLLGDGMVTLGALNVTYVDAATSANVSVQGGTGTTAAGAVGIRGAAAMTSATVTGASGANVLAGLAFGGQSAIGVLTVDAQSELETGNISGLAAGAQIILKGAGAARIGTLQAANVVGVDATANTGGVTIVLNDVTGISLAGGSGNDAITTGAVLVDGASVDAGAGTDRLIVANSAHVTSVTGKFYKGFEQLQVQNGVSVNVAHLADHNGIAAVRINASGGTSGVTNLSAAQAQSVTILQAAAGSSISIGVKDASTPGQIDTVRLSLETTLAGGIANDMDLSGLNLTGVEHLVLNGKGAESTATGTVKLTISNSMSSLSSVLINNAGDTEITFIHNFNGWGLPWIIDASGSSGNATITADSTLTIVHLSLTGGAGNDVLRGLRSGGNEISGGDGNDVIAGSAISGFTQGTAGAPGTVTGTIAQSTRSDTLAGGAGRDVFAIGQVDAIGNISHIPDLDLGGGDAASGVDALYFDLATAGPVTVVSLNDIQKADVEAQTSLEIAVNLVLQTASGTNAAVQFSYKGGTYIAVNGVNAGWSAADDALVRVTGVTGALDASDIFIL